MHHDVPPLAPRATERRGFLQRWDPDGSRMTIVAVLLVVALLLAEGIPLVAAGRRERERGRAADTAATHGSARTTR